MAHTTTLRAHEAARASDARFRWPCSSRASKYLISPAWPSAIQRGKYASSGESSTGAMPTSSNPAPVAARITALVISVDRSTAIRKKDQTLSGQFLEPAQPSFGFKLEVRSTFKLRNHSPPQQRSSFVTLGCVLKCTSSAQLAS